MTTMREATRIVSLLPSGTEMVFLLGCGERLVGVSHECNFPQAALALPKLTSSPLHASQSSRDIDDVVSRNVAEGQPLYEIDLARLAELEPDLIITQSQCDVCAVKLDDVQAAIEASPQLSKTRLLTMAPQTLSDVENDLKRLAEAIGLPRSQIDAAIVGLQSRLDRVARSCEGFGQRPRALLIEWLEPLMVAANWNPQLMTIAGADYGLAAAGQHSRYHDWAEIRAFDPQVLIVSPCGFDLDRTALEIDLLTARPGFADVAAAQNGRVFLVDGDAYFNRSGPRLIDSLEIAAHLLHPERFPDLHRRAWRRMESS